MKSRVFVLLVLWACGWGISLRGQSDFLTFQEIAQVRDAQQPSKRLTLYLEFAQRRLDAVQERLASQDSDAGRAVQKTLVEYISILEALEGTIEDAREQRSSTSKVLKKVEEQGAQFLEYLQSLQSGDSPKWSDYQFTLEEAIDMTKEVIAEAMRGPFPEIGKRESPTQLVSQPQSLYPCGPRGRSPRAKIGRLYDSYGGRTSRRDFILFLARRRLHTSTISVSDSPAAGNSLLSS